MYEVESLQVLNINSLSYNNTILTLETMQNQRIASFIAKKCIKFLFCSLVDSVAEQHF